jgi:hypothetical protein
MDFRETGDVHIANNLVVNTEGTTRSFNFRSEGALLEGNLEFESLEQAGISAADFTLLEDSPAIDSGVTVPLVIEDYYGNERPVGSGYDVGAVESAW